MSIVLTFIRFVSRCSIFDTRIVVRISLYEMFDKIVMHMVQLSCFA